MIEAGVPSPISVSAAAWSASPIRVRRRTPLIVVFSDWTTPKPGLMFAVRLDPVEVVRERIADLFHFNSRCQRNAFNHSHRKRAAPHACGTSKADRIVHR